MTELMIIVPTRERPHQLEPMLLAFQATCRADTRVVFVVDGADSAAQYHAEWDRLHDLGAVNRGLMLVCQERRRMIGTLNFAIRLIPYNEAFAVGYMGDDHRPVTSGWDQRYLDVLRQLKTGMVFGDDGHQGANLPTQIAMTVDIPQTLGYMVPPGLNHMYCDNYWKDVGEGAGCITYLPDVHVVHIHPAIHLAGKWDASYAQSNSADSYARDKAAYEQLVASGTLAADIEKICALRAAAYGGDQ